MVHEYLIVRIVSMSNLLRISEAASLALHSMVLLTANGEQLLSTREIASTLGVSEAHLAKVLQRLAKVALVRSVRGPRGGFVVGRSSEDITLLQVYEAIEGPLVPSTCLFGTPICGGEKCILGGALRSVHEQLREYLAETKLNELVDVFAGEPCTHSEKS